MEKRRREDAPLSAPNTEGNVWPKQVCPAFESRANTPEGMRQCWYCRCADFHLDKPRSLDVGVCYWPKKILKYTFDQYGVAADEPKDRTYSAYTVQRGDSFWAIARKLGCTMAELERLNNKSRFSIICPGDVLRVPEK